MVEQNYESKSTIEMIKESKRKNYEHRNEENGNCLAIGGFCTSVKDNAFKNGNCSKNQNRNCNNMVMEKDTICDICNRSYEQGRADATRWIPCSERLPEKEGAYIVCDQFGDVFVEWFRVLCVPEKDIKEFNSEVIAWMSLPEPYKGEEQK